MNLIAQQIKNLPDIPVPKNLRSKIMRRVLYQQFKTPLNILLALLLLNFINTGWRLWLRFHDTGAQFFVKDILTNFDFEFDRAYIADLFNVFFSMIPPTLILGFVINAVLLVYVIYLHIAFKHRIQRSKAL